MIFSRFLLILSFFAVAYAQPIISNEALSDIESSKQNAQLTTLATHDHLLIISPRFDDPGLLAFENFLNSRNESYKTLIASQEGLAPDKLTDSDGKGLYKGIILTEGALSFNDNGRWRSAFTQTEWQRLWDYQQDYGVRQVSLYTFPSNEPENYGLSLVKAIDTTHQRHAVNFTSQAKTQLSTPLETLYINGAYAYQSKLEPTEGITTTPLLVDQDGHIFAVASTVEGRERLAFTMAHSDFTEHTKELLPLALAWFSPTVITSTAAQTSGLNTDLQKFLIVNALFVLAFVLLYWLVQRRKMRHNLATHAGD